MGSPRVRLNQRLSMHAYTGALLSHKNERLADIHSIMDESQKYPEQEKSDSKEYILSDCIYMNFCRSQNQHRVEKGRRVIA